LASNVTAALSTFETGAVPLSIAGHSSKRICIQVRHFSAQSQSRPTDAEALAFRLERHGGLGDELSRRIATGLQPKRQGHRETPARAAAMSSSGLVPFSFSKRVLKK
jgi:hypothetical protein